MKEDYGQGDRLGVTAATPVRGLPTAPTQQHHGDGAEHDLEVFEHRKGGAARAIAGWVVPASARECPAIQSNSRLRVEHRSARRQLDQYRDQEQHGGCEREADGRHDDVYEASNPALAINGVERRRVYERKRRSAGSCRSVRRERRRHGAEAWQTPCARRGAMLLARACLDLNRFAAGRAAFRCSVYGVRAASVEPSRRASSAVRVTPRWRSLPSISISRGRNRYSRDHP